MSEPWDLTEPQRRQFREAHAAAKEAEMRAGRCTAYIRIGDGTGSAVLACDQPITHPGLLHYDKLARVYWQRTGAAPPLWQPGGTE